MWLGGVLRRRCSQRPVASPAGGMDTIVGASFAQLRPDLKRRRHFYRACAPPQPPPPPPADIVRVHRQSSASNFMRISVNNAMTGERRDVQRIRLQTCAAHAHTLRRLRRHKCHNRRRRRWRRETRDRLTSAHGGERDDRLSRRQILEYRCIGAGDEKAVRAAAAAAVHVLAIGNRQSVSAFAFTPLMERGHGVHIMRALCFA